MNWDADELLSHAEWMRRLALRILRDDEAASDVVQQTWLAVLEGRPTRVDCPRSWLASIVRRQAAFFRRSRENRKHYEIDSGPAEPASSPEELTARAEARRRLTGAVLGLSEPSRTAVLLSYYEGLSTRDIARRSGVSIATVQARLRRAIDELHARLTRGQSSEDGGLSWALLPSAGRRSGSRGSTRGRRSPLRWLGGGTAAVASSTGALAALAFVGVFAWQNHPGLGGSQQSPDALAPGSGAERQSELLERHGARVDGRLRSARTAVVAPAPPERDLVVVDAQGGAPLAHYALELDDGAVLWTDAQGHAPLVLPRDFAGDGAELKLLDDPTLWRQRVAEHTWTPEQAPQLRVPLSAGDQTRLEVASGPSYQLDFEAPVPPRTPLLAHLAPSWGNGHVAGKDFWAIDTARVRTKPDGQGWVRFLPLSQALLEARAPWRLQVRSANGLLGGEAQVTSIRGHEGRVRIDLAPLGRLDVRVLTAGPAPHESGFLRLLHPSFGQIAVPLAPGGMTTRFDALPAGRYRLQARTPLHALFETDVSIVAGEVLSKTLELQPLGPAGSIQGKLASRSGNAVTSSLVVLADPERVNADHFATVDWEGSERAVGHFVFEDVPPGNYDLFVASLGSHVSWSPAVRSVSPPVDDLEFLAADDVPRDDIRFDFDARALAREEIVVFYRRAKGPWYALCHLPGAARWDVRVRNIAWTQRSDPLVPRWPRGEPFEWIVVGQNVRPLRGDERDLVWEGDGGGRIRVPLEAGWSARLHVVLGDAPQSPGGGARILGAGKLLGVTDEEGYAFVGAATRPARLDIALPGWHVAGSAIDLKTITWSGNSLAVPIQLER